MTRRCVAAAVALAAACSSAQGDWSQPASGVAATARPERGTVCSSAPGGRGVARVVIRGATDGARACSVIGTLAGAPYDEVRGNADIHALFATRAFEDVTLVREDWGAGSALVFEVVERPILAGVKVRGAESPEAAEAVRDMPAAPARVDPVWTRKVARDLAAALEAEGHRAAKVTFSIDGGTVMFDLREGPRSLLGALRLEGLALAEERAVRSALRLAPGEPISDDLVERDRMMVEWSLFRRGFLEATATKEVEARDGGVDVTFRVVEGQRYRLGALELTGDISEELRASIRKRLRVGFPVDIGAASDAAGEVEDELRRTGKPGKVERALRPDQRTGTASLEIRVVAE